MAKGSDKAGPASHNPTDRQLRRLLRTLAGPGSAGTRVEMVGGRTEPEAKVHLTPAGAGAARTFARPVVDGAIADGLVEHDRERLRITRLGIARLKRMLADADPFTAQHRLTERRQIKTPAGQQEVRVNAAESPLTRLFARKRADGSRYIDDAELQAGERLRRDFERAQLRQSVSARWEGSVARSRGGPDAGLTIADVAIDARKRVDGAIAALNPDLAGAALDICCFLKGLETVERERGWPPRSAKLMLKTALALLARHYGIAGGGATATGAIRQWGTPDFRPSLDGE